MGEYAYRISDGQRIKIGTCEMNYYIRWEDKKNIKLEKGSEFGWFWRLPFIGEDNILEGRYENHSKAARLNNDFVFPEGVKDAGILQLKDECGLLVITYCYHGEKLPEGTDELRATWNGKVPQFYVLKYIKKKEGEPFYATIGCKFCNELWSLKLEDVVPFVVDSDLKHRLRERYVEYNKILRQAKEGER